VIISVITGTKLGKLSGVTGANRISSISGLTTGEVRGMSTDVEAVDAPTDNTAVAAAMDTPLTSDTRTDAPIRLLCCPMVYFWQDTRGVAVGECRRQLTMVRRQDDQQ